MIVIYDVIGWLLSVRHLVRRHASEASLEWNGMELLQAPARFMNKELIGWLNAESFIGQKGAQ